MVFSRSVQLADGSLVQGEVHDGPGAFMVKIYFPLTPYVEGREMPAGTDSVQIQLDFFEGDGREMRNGKPWPYMDLRINEINEDINNVQRSPELWTRILTVLRALRRGLSNSRVFRSRPLADRELSLHQVIFNTRKFSQPPNESMGVY